MITETHGAALLTSSVKLAKRAAKKCQPQCSYRCLPGGYYALAIGQSSVSRSHLFNSLFYDCRLYHIIHVPAAPQ